MTRNGRGRIRLAASAADVHAVLADYERYREWLPGVTRSRVLVHEGDIAIVELEAQRYAARPLTFEFVRATAERILFNQVGQLRKSGLGGALELAPDPEDDTLTQLEIETHLRLPPWRIAPGRLMRQALQEGLQALEAHLQALSRPGSTAARRRMLLEVRRRAGRLEVWYQGQVFSCPLDEEART